MTQVKRGNKYTAIIFDLGNTLIKFDHNIAARKLKDRFGIDTKLARDLFFDSELTRLFEKGLISPEEFHKDAAAALGITLPCEDFFAIWSDIFWLDEESCAIARRLKDHYRLIVLSNVNKVHFEHVRRRFDILDIFDDYVLSFAIGAMKPDKRIYDCAIRCAGGDRSKLLYIDDREDLIKEAIALGIDSVKYEGAGKLKESLRERGIL